MRRWSALEPWCAAALFAALTAFFAYPISFSPGSTSLGTDPDVHAFTWALAWDAHAFVAQPLRIFDANIFFPYDRTLAYSENQIGSAFFAAPLLWLTGNPVLALNGVSLLSCVLCGLGAYVLGRRLGMSAAAAVVCGIVFAFSPARFFRFPQTHLTTIQWMPFALAMFWTYLTDGRRRDVHLAIGFFTLQVITSGHGAVYTIVALAAMFLYRLLSGTPFAPLQRVRDAGVTGALLLLPSLLILLPYFIVQREMGLRRTLENWETTPESFIASPTYVHTWLMSLFSETNPNATASAFLFPGYIPLLLAAIAFLPARGTVPRRTAIFFLLLTLLAACLSAGPPIGLWPYVYWLPGLNFIRIPSRFFLLAVLGIAVLAGIGADRVTGSRTFGAFAPFARLRSRISALAVALVLGLTTEFALVPLPVQPYRVELPAIDRWLDAQPKPFSVAEVPVGPFTRYHSTYMLHSMAHWQKTVHGHSSLTPPLHERLYRELETFPDDTSLRTLTEIGVTHIVVHTEMYPLGEWTELQKRFDQFSKRLALLHVEGTGRVYTLQPPAAPALRR